MAGNSRDVELVLKAQNQASKAINDVADALDTLNKIQTTAGKSADRAGSLFERLAGDLQKLEAEAKGLAALGVVNQQIDKAAEAITRLKGEAAQTANDLASLKEQLQQASTNSAQLARSYNEAATALKTQKEALIAAKTEQSNANRAVRDAEGAISRLETRIRGVKQPTSDLTNALTAQKTALTDLKAKQDAAAASYAQQKASLDNAAKSLSVLKDQVSAANANQRVLEQSVSKASSTFDKQNAGIEKADAALANMQEIAGGAATALGKVSSTQLSVAASAEKTAAAITQVTAALAKQTSAGASGTPALSGVQLVKAQTEAQIENVVRAKAAFDSARQTANDLAAALAKSVGPNEELARSFDLAAAAAKRAKDDYLAAQAAVSGQGSFSTFDQRIVASENYVKAKQQEAQAARDAAAVEAQAAQQAADAASRAQSAETNRVVATARANLIAQQGGQANAALSASLKSTAAASSELAGETEKTRGVFSAFYGDSRQALSLFQRIRGEVLALAAGYVGLFAAIQNIGGVVTAYRTIEAAQNRLGAAFNQDGNKVTQEMQFLQVQASRLGIQFGVLSNEYAKFTIAATQANFQQDATRKIFLAVAEAARVQKLSLSDTEGVFLALQQMISKGKIQSEELRRQLGDRLPGAFNIMANALGMTTAELDKAMSAGQVFASQDNILKFADELTKRFSGQLPTALTTLTTQIGKFENSLFEAQAQVAQGGFAEALRQALVKLNDFFASKQGIEFFTGIGAAMGKVISLISTLVDHFQDIVTVIQIITAFKLAQTFALVGEKMQGLVVSATTGSKAFTSFAQIGAALRGEIAGITGGITAAGGAFIAFGAEARGAGVAVTAMSGAMNIGRAAVLGLANTFRALFVAAGGWIGIAVTIASFALTKYFTDQATAVDATSAALTEHERIMREVGTVYEATSGKINDAGKALKNVSLADANKNFIDLTNAAAKALNDFNKVNASALTGRAAATANPEVEAIKALVRQAQAGTLTIDAFKVKLNDLSKNLQTPEGIQLAASMDDLATKFVKAFTAAAEGGKIAKDLGSGLSEAAVAADFYAKNIQGAKDATDKQAEAAAAAAASQQAFSEAIAKLTDDFPALKKQAEDVKKVIDTLVDAFHAFSAALDTKSITQMAGVLASLGTGGPLAFMQALSEVGKGDFSKLGQVFSTLGQGLGSLVKGGNTGGAIDLSGVKGAVDAASTIIKQFEGFISTSKFDVNHFRVGFGSDTVTLSDGSVHEVVQGMTTSVEDANRDLTRRIGDIMLNLQKTLGPDTFNKLTDAQKGVLASLEYNFGKLPDSVEQAIKSGGTDAQIADAIRALGQTQDAISKNLTGRRNQEAATFAGDPQASLDKQLASQAEITKQIAEGNKLIEKRIQDGTFEVQNLQETARQQAINKALYEAENTAKEHGLTLTDEQKSKIAELAGQQFDLQNKDKEASKQKEEVEKRVNDLYQLRKELQDQILFAQQQGDNTKAAQLKDQLAGTDAQLKTAINDALAFYQKMGGDGADLAIAKLNTMANSIQEVHHGLIDAKEANDDLVNGLVDAFTQSAQAIAQVIGGTLSLKDGLKAVGQAFLQFAGNFLLQIGQMIIKQALFNALAGGGSGTGGVGGFLASLFHTGGVVGQGVAAQRMVDPRVFSFAQRFHGGGIPGLKPNEVPAILKKNEEVLTQNDPRNIINGGLGLAASQAGPSGGQVKIINAFDPASFLSEALKSREGEKAILNFVRSNPATFKQALGK